MIANQHYRKITSQVVDSHLLADLVRKTLAWSLFLLVGGFQVHSSGFHRLVVFLRSNDKPYIQMEAFIEVFV